MSNVVPFSRPGAPREVLIHWAEIAFMPLGNVEQRLAESMQWTNPLLFAGIVLGVGRSISLTTSDARARANGWADAATARERADALRRLVAEHLDRWELRRLDLPVL